MFERENANLSIVEYVFMKTNKNALSISHVFFPFFLPSHTIRFQRENEND